MRAIVAHQPPELARQQHAEGEHAAEVHQQNPRPQAVECGRVLHALGEQQERSQPDGAPQQRLRDRHPAQAPRALVHTGSNHEYHSLTRAQSLVQKRITRSDAGRCPRRTPARTLRLHQDRPGIHLAQVVQRLVQGGEALLIAALRVAHHVTLAHGVVAELAPQGQLDDIQVEPETPLTVHARLELERERQAVPQRAADGRTHRVLDARMQQKHPLVEVHVGGTHLECPVERVGPPEAPARQGHHAHRREQPAPDQTIPCRIAA